MVRSDALHRTDPEFRLFSRRNASLSRAQRRVLFGSLAVVSVGMASLFALAGAWPILPYSIAEMGLLFVAFRLFERRSGDWELLTVAGDRVVLEARHGGETVRHEFNRLWVRVELPEGDARRGDAMPTLRFAGRGVRFGEHLLPEDRERVARELGAVIARTR